MIDSARCQTVPVFPPSTRATGGPIPTYAERSALSQSGAESAYASNSLGSFHSSPIAFVERAPFPRPRHYLQTVLRISRANTLQALFLPFTAVNARYSKNRTMLRDEILSSGAELAIAVGVWMCRVPFNQYAIHRPNYT